MTNEEAAAPTDSAVWMVVELMGHVRLAGRVSEEEKFGSKMGRVDVPVGDGFVTQYFGGASVYRLTLVTEEVARSVAKNLTQPVPVSAWELPKAIAGYAHPNQRPYSDSEITGTESVEDDEAGW